MKLVAFLGNPGSRYRLNRHNIGFLLGDSFLRELNITAFQKKFSSIHAPGDVDEVQCCFLFPQTYMNESGKAVAEAKKFYSLDAEDIIIVHDDIELGFGEVRVKKGGGHKGQNGIRSIMAETGNGDFFRLRLGVGRPADSRISVADYVLSNFFQEEQQELVSILPRAGEILRSMITGSE